MAALAVSGSLLALILAVWMIALGVDHLLHKIFGGPKSIPRRHRPF